MTIEKPYTHKNIKDHADVLIIGGGIVGSAVAFGLAETGARTIILDEGDRAFRAARGNFGLVWYQGKGLGMQRYQQWSLEATRLWPEFAEKLQAQTGIDVSYRKPGGFNFCIGDSEYDARRNLIEKIRREAAPDPYDCRMLDRKAVHALLPGIKLGDAVVGASFCPHDGHVNPLALLRALHAGIKKFGGFYFPGHPVSDIVRHGNRFILKTHGGAFTAPKLVIAAGNGTGKLAQRVGMHMPVRPEKGEILVTERTAPCLPFPCNRIQQTAEGSFLLGASQENSGFDVQIKTRVIRDISNRARTVFPALANLKVIRTWAALRVLTPDKMPIYDMSGSSPEVFAIALHSGVTLASVHAARLPDWILHGHPPEGFQNFHSRRFHV
jgi:glycine/D-amino acid oxidase-like deaminating enzyme